jgi:hypothetical protein
VVGVNKWTVFPLWIKCIQGVSSVLDYSVEGKEEDQFDAWLLEMTLKPSICKRRLAIPFAVLNQQFWSF